MPVLEFECQDCGRSFSDLFGMTAEPGSAECPLCKSSNTARRVSKAHFHLPDWMSDDAIEARKRHREWLMSPEAKRMDLTHSPSEDPEGDGEADVPAAPGPSADEIFAGLASAANLDCAERYVADTLGAETAGEFVQQMTTPAEEAA